MQARSKTNQLVLDISRWNGYPDYKQVASHVFPDGRKIEGIIPRATMGHTYVDPMLEYNFKGAKSVGLKLGLYHVLCAASEAMAEQEAYFFISTLERLGGITSLDIVPCLDVEEVYGDPSQLPNNVRRWMEVVESHIRYRPYLYSYPHFINNFLHGLTDYPLWLADYSNVQPGNYGGWTKWGMLQFSSHEHVAGILSNVDCSEVDGGLDMYRMSKEDADKLITICSLNWGMAKTQEDKDHWHYLANELRLASGQQPQQPL